MCFLCNGSHWAKDCPTKGKIIVIVPAAREYKEEETLARASTLHILGAMRAGHTTSGEIGLMLVLIVLNKKKVSALLDIGATYSFVSKGMAKELGLKIGINNGN